MAQGNSPNYFPPPRVGIIYPLQSYYNTNRVAGAWFPDWNEQWSQASYVLQLWCGTYHMIARLRTGRYKVTIMRQCTLPRYMLEHRLRGVTEKTTGCVMLSVEKPIEHHLSEEELIRRAELTSYSSLDLDDVSGG